MHRIALWIVRLGAVGMAVLFSMLLLAGAALHWVILPHIDRWRPQLAERAGRALGVPVGIGAIAVQANGWAPVIELRDVTLHDAAGRPALRLPRIVATLGARSLLAAIVRLEPRVDQLVVDGAELDVRRDARGRLFVAGIPLGGDDAAGDDGGGADWALRQREIVLRGATLRWTDEQRPEAVPLVLGAVDLVLRNGVRSHALRLDATPPPGWGERFTLRGLFRQPLLARPADWRRWNGTAYAQLPHADLKQLRRHVELPFELTEGDGALRGWIDLRDGRPEGLTVDVALRSVVLRLGNAAEPLALQRVSGRIVAAERAGRGSVALQRLAFVTGDGIDWPAGDLRAGWTREPEAAGGGLAGGSFSADRIDLAVVAQTAARLPLGEAPQRLIAALQPRGILGGVQASWDGPLDAPRHYRLQAKARALAIESQPSDEPAEPGWPGLRNAEVTLAATEKGGEARLSVDGGGLDLPGVFADPALPVDRLRAHVLWNIEPARRGAARGGLGVQVKEASLANADARLAFGASWHTGPGEGHGRGGRYPGRLRLDGTLHDGRLDRIARYLPVGLSAGPRHYVERALRGGSVKSATFRVDGDIADFPAFAPARPGAPPSGEFHVAARLDDVTLAYVPPAAGSREPPPWPVATEASGEIVFDRASMQLNKVAAASPAWRSPACRRASPT